VAGLRPKFANFFGMVLAPPRLINLAPSMADKGPILGKIVEMNGLENSAFVFPRVFGLSARADHSLTCQGFA
jgi:hypothetical protein